MEWDGEPGEGHPEGSVVATRALSLTEFHVGDGVSSGAPSWASRQRLTLTCRKVPFDAMILLQATERRFDGAGPVAMQPVRISVEALHRMTGGDAIFEAHSPSSLISRLVPCGT